MEKSSVQFNNGSETHINGDSPKEFDKIMSGLVSNDVKVREKSLDQVKEMLINEYSENAQETQKVFAKIWRSLFYFYWNADKPVYQKRMADKLADLIFSQEWDANSTHTQINTQNFNSENYEMWIKTFMLEFIKKWPKIDFHRMDKYILLTQTIVKRYFEVNLLNENFQNLINFFDLISVCITSGYYNFSFVSVILKLISFFIEDIFKNEGDVEIKRKFLEGYFMEFFEKLLKIFINVKDNRENTSFRDYIFIKVYEKFSQKDNSIINITEYKLTFTKRLFDFAKSKENIPDNKRKIIYKIYKQMKYDQDVWNEENEKTQVYSADPVNRYILNKNYTHKVKMSKLDRMKRMIERQKNEKRIKKILEEEERKRKEKELETKNKEEILEENVVRVDEEEEISDNASDNSENEGDELEFEEEEYDEGDVYEDEENGYWNSLLNNSGSDEEFEGGDQIYSDEDDFEDEEFEENEDGDEVELDPRFLYFLVDSGNDALQEISEEDRKIIEAYKNCQKNTHILKPKLKNKKINEKQKKYKNNSNTQNTQNIQNTKQSSTPERKHSEEKTNSNNNNTNSNSNNKSVNNNINNVPSKRKNSVNSQTSNGNIRRKKNVVFKFSSNQFNEYDQSKPITLTSKGHPKDSNKSNTSLKGSLKPNKNRK